MSCLNVASVYKDELFMNQKQGFLARKTYSVHESSGMHQLGDHRIGYGDPLPSMPIFISMRELL